MIEHLPDLDRQSTKDLPNEREVAFAKQICDSAGVGDDFVRAWRVPTHENSTRPLKIELRTVKSRDTVLRNFRKGFSPLAENWKPGNGRRISACRHMSRPELQIHRNA